MGSAILGLHYHYIQMLKRGDMLVSYNPATHELYPDPVQKVISYTVNKEYIINGNIGTDGAQKVFVLNSTSNTGSWVSVSNISVGDRIFNPYNNTYITVRSIVIKYVPNGFTVYDVIGTLSNDFVADGMLSDGITN